MEAGYLSFTAAGWNCEFVLILATTLDKSDMTTPTWCSKALDQAAGYRLHLFWKTVTWR